MVVRGRGGGVVVSSGGGRCVGMGQRRINRGTAIWLLTSLLFTEFRLAESRLGHLVPVVWLTVEGSVQGHQLPPNQKCQRGCAEGGKESIMVTMDTNLNWLRSSSRCSQRQSINAHLLLSELWGDEGQWWFTGNLAYDPREYP